MCMNLYTYIRTGMYVYTHVHGNGYDITPAAAHKHLSFLNGLYGRILQLIYVYSTGPQAQTGVGQPIPKRGSGLQRYLTHKKQQPPRGPP